MMVNVFGFYITTEKPGVISEGPVWICCYGGCWMHCCGTLRELIWSVATEYKSDRHLVG